MPILRYITLVYSCLLLFSCNDHNSKQQEKTQPNVKQSKSGTCHDESSASYSRTTNYQTFETVADCIVEGGRLPKSKTKDIDKATQEAAQEGRAFGSLYDRNEWPHWIDDDKDFQNTRHELLIESSLLAVTFKTNNNCIVMTGSWNDLYSGRVYTNSKDLDLDHVVPLKFAHGHGGDKWTRERKQAFANDVDNLLLVDASLNRQKGAKSLDEWLPPSKEYIG